MGEKNKYVVAMREESDGKTIPGKELGRYRQKKVAKKVIPILARREGIPHFDKWKLAIFLGGELVE